MALRRALRKRFRVFFFFKQRSDSFFFFYQWVWPSYAIVCQKQVFITQEKHKKQRKMLTSNVQYMLTFSFFISLKIKFVKKITKKDKKNCQKLSKVAQKAKKLPVIVLLVCTLGCPLILPKNKK